MDQTFETNFNNYSVCVGLTKQTIYFKLIDTISFTMFEANADSKEFGQDLKLRDIYQIVTKCFKGEPGYSANPLADLANPGVYKLQFSAIVGGFLEVNFEVMLKEKSMSDFDKLEQRLNTKMEKFQEQIDSLQGENLRLLNIISSIQIPIATYIHPDIGFYIHKNCFESISTKNLKISYTTPNQIIWHSIKSLFQLETLEITGTNTNLKLFSSSSLKELSIYLSGQEGMRTIQGIENFPQLERLTITGAPGLSNIPGVLKSTPNKINYIKIQSCGLVIMGELLTYCQENNIKLDI